MEMVETVEVVEINTTPGDEGGMATLIHSTLGLPLGPKAGMEVLKVLSGDHGIRLLVENSVLATVAG